MTTVNKPKPKPVGSASSTPSNRLAVETKPGSSEAALVARNALRPTVQAGITATRLLAPSLPEPDLGELIKALLEQVTDASKGDLSRMEAMMVSQAQTLDLLFNTLTRRAVANIGEYKDAVETYLKLALRAQSQCRAVAETLHEMKHPRPVAFFQQANIANGPQQVNNGSPVPAQRSRAGENKKAPNELFKDTDRGNQLECRATGATQPSHTPMAALGQIDGAKVEAREKEI